MEDHSKHCQDLFFAKLFTETVGFCGAKMIRRIVGIAHVEDLESIKDVDVKVKCERHALEIGKELVKNAHSYQTIEQVIAMLHEKV
jgi:5-methylthioribose kinase